MSSNNHENDDLISRILESVFFKTSLGKAGRISKNSGKILNLIRQSLVKVQELGPGGVFDNIRKKITLIGSLLKAYASGEYRHVELKSIVVLTASLVYFLSPIDLLPDFLPFLGYADDIALLSYVLGLLSDELEKFELWELNNRR